MHTMLGSTFHISNFLITYKPLIDTQSMIRPIQIKIQSQSQRLSNRQIHLFSNGFATAILIIQDLFRH